eukprot:1644354-Amphidinium_carterae.1
MAKATTAGPQTIRQQARGPEPKVDCAICLRLNLAKTNMLRCIAYVAPPNRYPGAMLIPESYRSGCVSVVHLLAPSEGSYGSVIAQEVIRIPCLDSCKA